jgi:hypothetical protein
LRVFASGTGTPSRREYGDAAEHRAPLDSWSMSGLVSCLQLYHQSLSQPIDVNRLGGAASAFALDKYVALAKH